MGNFDKKNHEEQSSKIPARLFNLYCIDSRHSSIGSVSVKIKDFNNENEHGKRRPYYQSDNRCNHCNTLFYQHYHRNFGNCAFGSCRGICTDKLNQFLSPLRTLRAENMRDKKNSKSRQRTKYISNGCSYVIKQIRSAQETLWRFSA
jgi:hypothetical protein